MNGDGTGDEHGGTATDEANPTLAPPAAARVGRDTLFAAPADDPHGGDAPPFRFDADVARVFPDMLDRSIPGYASIVAQTGLLAARFARPGTHLHDLGCSLGAGALAMRAALATRLDDAFPDAGPGDGTGKGADGAGRAGHPDGDGARPAGRYAGCRITGIDNSPAMLERARALLADTVARTPSDVVAPPVELVEADLVGHALAPCSVVAMNFTLQFVPPADRAALLARVARSLVPGGALILSEKIRFEDPELDALHVELYHAFKRANGYSSSEIARKRAALEEVLVPDTLAAHEARLRGAGFARTSVWFQCFNFVSLIAIR